MQSSSFVEGFQRLIVSVLLALGLMLLQKHAYAQSIFPAGQVVYGPDYAPEIHYSTPTYACQASAAHWGAVMTGLSAPYGGPEYVLNVGPYTYIGKIYLCYFAGSPYNETQNRINTEVLNYPAPSSDPSKQTTANDTHASCDCDLQDGGD